MLFYAFMILILMTVVVTLNRQNDPPKYLYSDIVELFENEQVKSFVVEGSDLKITLKEPIDGSDSVVHRLYSFAVFFENLNELILQQHADGILEDYDYDEGFVPPWWWGALPYLTLALMLGLIWFMTNRVSGGGGAGAGGAMKFGKARTRLGSEEKKKITFSDVAGCEEEKAELQEVVEFLKHPASFTEMGARIPKGVLLVGPPGTGKTLIAKAVAGEAGVQFLSISGSDFVELYVGVGASRVRDLFEQAKKIAPAIIFIDEIDAVGRQRGAGMGGGHDEREQTLNQLLVEMDGFGNNEGVIVMAATNRADILDNALLRPGRFDRRVYIGMPDIRGREAILKVHAKGKPFGEDVSLNSIAKGTPGFSGADLENLLNEAALLAVRNSRRFIMMPDIEEAILKVMAGPEKKSRVMSEKAKKLTAYHEAGHAVAGKFLANTDPVHYITIVPRGPTGGMTIFRPQEDLESYNSKSELFENIVMSLGGRVAEKLFLDDISTGASGDIQQASAMARAMVMKYGMSDKLGPISFDNSDHSIFIGRDFGTTKSYSEETAALIDTEVKHIFDEAYAECERILSENREVLISVAEYLLSNESMDGADFHHFCDTGELPEPKKEEPVSPKELKPVTEETSEFEQDENGFDNEESLDDGEEFDFEPEFNVEDDEAEE